ncbi:MAG: Uma2 family endonuclease [Chloroflexi bacterium]|nr:MAG: Uma2 family endonuclease [Chloroflexota bacterium]
MSEKTRETAVAYRVHPIVQWVEGVETLPPLESGDRLTRAEFERRYEAMPHLKKAELIKGVVYIGASVPILHAEAQADIVGVCGFYTIYTPGISAADNGSLRMDDENELQPDLSLWIDRAGKGRARVDEDDFLVGAPELIVEVVDNREAYNLQDKMDVYRDKGVQELSLWRVADDRFDWFRLEGDEYQRITPDEKGIITSTTFPGLWLNAQALIAGNLAAVMGDLQAGLQSDEHRHFVEWLASDDDKPGE